MNSSVGQDAGNKEYNVQDLALRTVGGMGGRNGWLF